MREAVTTRLTHCSTTQAYQEREMNQMAVLAASPNRNANVCVMTPRQQQTSGIIFHGSKLQSQIGKENGSLHGCMNNLYKSLQQLAFTFVP
jgi:hypothetical protein